MKRTQIQVPTDVYRQVAMVARKREWSISEVFRRAAELYVAECSHASIENTWALAEPSSLGVEQIPVASWRDVIADDEGRA
jgi:hypothetical protein